MAKDFKDTLNLPKTDFPMKANLTQREAQFLNFWKEKRIYEKIQEKNRENQSFILHDGPPYANGHIHIGHALNKILKDIIVKYHSMKGFYSPYVPGWDCHGLPIELQIDKQLGSKKHDVNISEKRKLCREYAEKFLNIQRDEFIRLGCIGDWQRPYVTMDYGYEASIVREFYRFLAGGYVYRGKKPVHWCPSCITALAEAEVEYAEKQSPSIYVTFKIIGEDRKRIGLASFHTDVSMVIWTTTPWTLPANLALAVHPEVEYAVIKRADGYYIVADMLMEKLGETIGIDGEVLKKIKGSELEGVNTTHPFIDRKSSIILGDFVTTEEGTGIVHIAPGHGEDDYEAGLRYGLDIYAPVDDRGRFTKHAGPLEGQFVFKANQEIIEILKSNHALMGYSDIVHSYPHCWRCKKPVIFRATEQWFISMKTEDLREKCLDEIKKVRWIPSWGKERIYGMVENRPDWCISRQRSWGVPIAVILCNDCGEIVTDQEVLDGILERFAEKGADIWFELQASVFLPDAYACKKCKGTTFSKEVDILDVWFDSGVSHAAVVERDERLKWPAEMYLEGSDQHRGWFQSSLIASTGTRGISPFKIVLTHGFVVDGKGKKMSKSLGNVISPQDMIKKNGAEILRLWVSAEDYRDDVRISAEIIQRLTEAYRKIRNTCRFLLGNIHDFEDGDYSASLLEIDLWAMSRLQHLIKSVTRSYQNFDFHEVFHGLYNFCVVDMSSFYLDILKDRVYTLGRNSFERGAAQWTMKQILSSMIRLMAPVLSFTAEEVWQYLKSEIRNQKSEIGESVFLSSFPEIDGHFLNEDLEKRWESLIEIRDTVNKALELRREEKFIGNSLEAKVILFAETTFDDLLSKYREFLPTLFIVSQSEVENYSALSTLSGEERKNVYDSEELKGLSVLVRKADGKKCERCWNVSTSVGSFPDEPEICERCYQVLAHSHSS